MPRPAIHLVSSLLITRRTPSACLVRRDWFAVEGAEQNAPLGRAVIGGLLFATVSTLLFVPVVFAGVHERLARRRAAHADAAAATLHTALQER